MANGAVRDDRRFDAVTPEPTRIRDGAGDGAETYVGERDARAKSFHARSVCASSRTRAGQSLLEEPVPDVPVPDEPVPDELADAASVGDFAVAEAPEEVPADDPDPAESVL